MVDYRVLPTGDTAVVVEFGESITRQVNVIVLALDECLGSERHEGILETVPTFRGLNVIGRSPVAMWQPDDGASLKPGDKVIFPTRIPRHGRSARSRKSQDRAGDRAIVNCLVDGVSQNATARADDVCAGSKRCCRSENWPSESGGMI